MRINLDMNVARAFLQIGVGLSHFQLNNLPVIKTNHTTHGIHHKLRNVVNVRACGATNHLFSPILELVKRADATTLEVNLGAPHLAIQPNHNRNTFRVNNILFPEQFRSSLQEHGFVSVQILLGWVVESLKLSVAGPAHGFGLARQVAFIAVVGIIVCWAIIGDQINGIS